ncbi:MAG: intradiol ring-cleavage dioxygenase [Pyrinomonadaceae bacterium]|nr:intradiol ring-cleavage dioxygenase [Pyrinomonadaceae bacterium]
MAQFARREILVLLATAAASPLLGCARGAAGPSGPYSQQTVAGCLVSPEATQGPFFVDEKLNRSDIRVDPANGSISPGLQLRVVLHVNQVTNNTCTPLAGATVDLWHCDALGSYSDVRDNAGGSSRDTRGKKFLRGYQITDRQGKVEFLTVYPGWYQGRNVHVHYKIRTNPSSPAGHEFTSQLYFDEAITDQVHAQSPYSQKGRRDTTNANDGIFSRGGSDAMLQLSQEAGGYLGVYRVGFLLT